ncbi:MAG: Chromosomal replication initiator protein DnaA [Eubacteriales bacterium SKADARSKE-1]|nr:Chromosomal replication initiator protein DnaA [Eubacteriales bacterium SKADARSKE-1]
MGYSYETYELANKILESVRAKNVRENEKKKRLFYMRFNRAREIETLLSQTAVSVAKSVLNGNDTKEQLKKLKNFNLSLQNELNEILTNANLPLNYLEVSYDCNKCKDTGYVDGKMCECFKKLLRSETYKRLNNLSPLSLSTFDSFNLEYYSSEETGTGVSNRRKMERILNHCINYADKFNLDSENLFMNGATGLGKTHLSLAIANTAINKGFGVIYASTPAIVSKLEKERFRRTEDNEDSEIHLINCDLLILDDLGTEFQTTFSNSTIYNIINSRILYNKPTIISTNIPPKKIQTSYSERLVSRLWGHYKLLNFCGQDVRTKLGAQKAKKSMSAEC